MTVKDKVILYTNDDGIFVVSHPVPEMFDPNSKTRQLLASQGITLSTDQELEAFIIKKAKLTGKSYRLMDKALLPTDRYYRGAWEDSTPTEGIDIDCTKAKDLALADLREKRNKLLEEEDKKWLRDYSQGKDVTAIEARKQSLRDSTEPLKAIDVAGVKNHAVILEQMKQLAVIE